MKAPSTHVFLGCVAGALSIFIFHQTRHAALGWHVWPILRSFIAYQMWGFGLTPLLPMLLPRLLRGSAEPPLVRQSPFGLTPDRV